MGLLIGTSKILADICSRNKMSGNALTLGHQRVLVTAKQVRAESKMSAIDTSLESNFEWHPRWRQEFVTCSALMKALGFSAVESLDVSNYEGADIKFDMNFRDTPNDLMSRFDLIFDGSTLEHIFGASGAICHIVKMLKVGGHVIHISPCNNWIDDGFYQFSPIFFKEFYLGNGFEILSLDFHQFRVIQDPEEYGVFETEDFLTPYSPVEIPENALMNDGFSLDSSMPTQLIVVAKKINEIDSVEFPQQGRYSQKEYWQEGLK